MWFVKLVILLQMYMTDQNKELMHGVCNQGRNKTWTNSETISISSMWLELFTKNHFEMHFRTHTVGELYQCRQCNKAFSRKNNFDRLFRKHTRDNPYLCSQCEKAFLYRS